MGTKAVLFRESEIIPGAYERARVWYDGYPDWMLPRLNKLTEEEVDEAFSLGDLRGVDPVEAMSDPAGCSESLTLTAADCMSYAEYGYLLDGGTWVQVKLV